MNKPLLAKYMMPAHLIVAALMLSGLNAFAYTDCSDATGANRYEETNYRGGPAPLPTTVSDDVKIYLNNTLASETITHFDGSNTAGPLVADFDESSMNLLSSLNEGFIKDYTIRVTFRTADQSQFPGGGPPPPVFLVLCHQDNTPVP